METLLQDLRYGIRNLTKNPGFSAIALITLALGIGANTAMFTTVNAVLLRPLAYPDAEALVLIEGMNPSQGITRSAMSVPDLVDWQNQNQSFEQLAGFVTGGTFLAAGNETERVRTASVSESFFRLLRVNALQGRTLQKDDENESNPGVVLSYGLWQRRFGGDPNVIGSKATLNGEPAAIVGVMPAGFDYPERSELWAAFALDAAAERRDNRFLGVVGRLKPGVSIQQAQSDLDTINQRNAQSFNETNSGWSARVTNLRERLVGDVRPSLLILTGAVAFVLLIACANVANLLLSRATARQKEIAVRTALGASRGQIIRQLLTESLLLSIIGGLAGLGFSVWLTRLLISISPPDSPRFDEIQIDARVFAFTFGVTILTGLAFGLVPALQTSRVDLNEGLKGTSRGASAGQRQNRVGSVLIVSEIALSFMLLVGAGLLVKSFLRLRDVNPGFNPHNVITMRVTRTPGKYPAGPARAQLFRDITEKIKNVPGVQSVGATLTLPLGGDSFDVDRGYVVEGRPATPEEAGNADYLAITPDYFRAMQVPLFEGRAFKDQDTEQSPKVLIINQTMARRVWPGENPIGKRLTIWRDETFPREVVGVVGDTKETLATDSSQQMYVPYAQDSVWGSLTFAVRTTSADPAALAPTLRNEIRSIDSGLATYNVKTLEDVVATDVAPRRSSMLLFGAFAMVAVLLSMIGIYGVTAYYVTHRTHEIGIRMALGAQMRDVLALVLKRGVVLAGIGIAVGIAGAFGLTRLMTKLLFGVKPVDALTFAIVSVGVLAVAVIACYIPARRATKVDPLIALRYE